MLCIKCGKEIPDGSNFCIHCRAAQTNAVAKKKIIIIIAAIAVLIVGIIIGILAITGNSGLSGTWVSDTYPCDYTIKLNADGSCVVYEYGNPYAANYIRNDDGTYTISNLFTRNFFGAWTFKKDGNDLLVSGPYLEDNTKFTKANGKTLLQDTNQNGANNNSLFLIEEVGGGAKITGFVGDYGEGNIVIPETINGLAVIEIGDYAFIDKRYLDGSPLRSIVIPYGVTKIGNCAFEGCSNLTSVTIPKSVTKIGDRAFNLCRSLERVTIPESVTEIGDCAFGSCINLTSINIPSAIKKISPSTFGYCVNLKQLTLPDGLTEIGSYAFCECGITELIIPDTVTKIGEGAFSESGLTSITIPSGVKEIEKYTFRQKDLPLIICFPRTVGKRKELNFTSPLKPSPIEVNFTGKLSWLGMDAFDENSTINYKGKSYSVENLYWVVNGEPFNQAFSTAK